MSRIKYLLIFSLPIIYMGLIWYASSHPSDHMLHSSIALKNNLKDTVNFRQVAEALHLVEFALLYGLFVLALFIAGKLNIRTNNIAAGIAIAYGALDEVHQHFIPYRSATFNDLFKDSIGVMVVWVIVSKIYFKQNV